MTPITQPFLTSPPADVHGWVASFHQRDIPVLAETAQAIAGLGANEDAVDAHMLSEAVADDPLMVLKLLRHVAERRSARALTDIETVTAAIVLMGVPPFFHAFGAVASIEDRLASHPDALVGLHAVLTRARRAARFALGFAVHRLDHDAAVIHEAALLHDFAEMLLWIHAPALAQEIAQRQLAAPTLRSADVQRELLQVTLSDLQQALMKTWRLPELLVRISDDHTSTSPQVRNVQLAIRVARHSARGWDNPALPDDIVDIAQLLNLGREPTLQLLHEIDD
jgi:HD-like signal output (HDOD) protein